MDLAQILYSGDILDVITDANFGNDRLRGFSVARGQILGFFIGFRRHPYITLIHYHFAEFLSVFCFDC